MNRIEKEVISTGHLLETLRFLCLYAPMATKITQIHFETGGAEPISRIGHPPSI
jgi:hypothetical protein